MVAQSPKSNRTQRYIMAGMLTIIPIWVTFLVVVFFADIISGVGSPIVNLLANRLSPFFPALGKWLLRPLFQTLLALIFVFITLYLLGWAATRVIGGRLISWIDTLIARIPLVQLIYGSTKRFLSSFQNKSLGAQRVVLINFPTDKMKAVGFVTRTFKDDKTGKELAAVYVPTTPNPTSGYLEIVPVEHIIATDWTIDEAMTFIVSGGIVGPDTMHFDKGIDDIFPMKS